MDVSGLNVLELTADSDRSLQSDLNLDSAVFTRGIVALTSVLLLVFYFVQFLRSKCDWEVAYIQLVTVVNYGSLVVTDWNVIFYTTANGDDFALGRYLSWLMTCPVIIIQYMRLYSTFGPGYDVHKTNSLIVKDLVMNILGIYSVLAQNIILKYCLYAAGCLLWGLLIRDLYGQYLLRRGYFHEKDKSYMHMLTLSFIGAWLVFPTLHVLGRNMTGVLSQELEAVGFAIGDLTSKNMFGLFAWYIKYNILLDSLDEIKRENEQQDGKQLVLPSLKPAQKFRRAAHFQQLQNNWNNRTFVDNLNLLCIEPNVAYQRLLEYIMDGVSAKVSLASNASEASKILYRNDLSCFSAVLFDMTYFREDTSDMRSLFEQVSGFPYYLPVIAFSFQPIKSIEEFAEVTQEFSSNYIKDIFNDVHVLDVIRHSIKTSNLNKGVDNAETFALRERFPQMLHTKGLWTEEAFDAPHNSLKESVEQLKSTNSPWEKKYTTALLDREPVAYQ